MSENAENTKTTVKEFIKFNLVSFLVTLSQLVLVNLFLYLMKDWKAPLPGFLNEIFRTEVVGEGNNNWGYVLPFFLSNAIANVIGYFINRKATFKSNSPKWMVVVFLVVLSVLILIGTWVQGRLVYLIRMNYPSLASLAPTIASFTAGILQFLVLFPLEKFFLFKRKES